MTSERTANSRAVIRQTGYPSSLPSGPAWDLKGRVEYHYWLGHSAIGFLVERYGEQKMFQLVAEHYRGTAIDAVTQDVLGASSEEFEQAWAAYLKAELR
ncbi:hypothetical protein [Micromonospora sp. CB01531]|uniref:hypothetical protein n=1 Tax=Micromonospora sp. CB01531 TaxID=1718947 RepID=UPI00095B5479|nr:hypothetical protein [Micromonospora sp. CB01531]OKI57847.1 hypothetical protein A6A27_06195 [Micromonospora sp. CB01531]